MKVVIALLAFMILSQAQAQTTQVDQQGDAVVMQPAPTLPAAPKKRTVLYDERTNELVEVAPDVVAQAPQSVPAQPAVSASPIYILNNQKYQGYQGTNQATAQETTQEAAQGQIQEQPTTIIQDSPMKNSMADGMRKRRQDTESATEDGIVQALEKARMDDEIRRRDRFNSAIGTGAVEHQTQVQPVQQVVQPIQVIQPVPVVQSAPAPIVVVDDSRENEDYEPKKKKAKVEVEEDAADAVDIRSEIRAAVQEATAKPQNPTTYYVSGLVGLGKYPDVVNVRGNVASGVLVGAVTPERVVAEGSFIYGDYELEDMWRTNPYYPQFPRIVDMRQYNFGATVKYQILPGKLRPNIGAMVSYARRTFAENGTDFRSSDAFDIGLVTGVDLQLTDAFAIGFDFRYSTNIAYRENTDYRTSFVYPQSQNEIEKLDYYTGTLAGKFTF